jgi:phosphopentomutase
MAATPFRRAIVIVLDSVGVGELPDAADYGDEGSNTLGNVAVQVRLQIPILNRLGMGWIVPLARLARPAVAAGAYGRMAERSPGKDSVTGHWELMGLVLDRAFPVFPHGFPEESIREFERRIGRRTLGNVVASGTEILNVLGAEHMRTGWPIVYTSADSVFQIAAHEDVIPVPDLYRMCEIAYEMFVRCVCPHDQPARLRLVAAEGDAARSPDGRQRDGGRDREDRGPVRRQGHQPGGSHHLGR